MSTGRSEVSLVRSFLSDPLVLKATLDLIANYTSTLVPLTDKPTLLEHDLIQIRFNTAAFLSMTLIAGSIFHFV